LLLAAPEPNQGERMPEAAAGPQRPDPGNLTREERKSLTHGEFWIPEEERGIYQRALRALNEAGIPFVITGTYAIYEYTGIYRETKDLDLFVEPAMVEETFRVLKQAGFIAHLEQPHWLAKAMDGEYFVDIIFGMGNGLALVDDGWYRHSTPAILAAHPVRVAPPEELIWHRLFISERHRQDTADIAHLILCMGDRLDWSRLLRRTGEHWPLLLAQLQIFSYVYPEIEERVPRGVMEELLERARGELDRPRTSAPVTRGTVISRFSFAIDVNEWGFEDVRARMVRQQQSLPLIRQLATSEVWDQRSQIVEECMEAWQEAGARG
jgi:hypothetical protein